MSTYSDKLKDPRWQRKRLEIMDRDGWKCRNCGDEKSTLHVHHWFYDGEPWEINSKFLSTLCEKCHEHAEAVIAAVKPFQYVGDMMKLTCMAYFNSGPKNPTYCISDNDDLLAFVFTEESEKQARNDAVLLRMAQYLEEVAEKCKYEQQ